MTPLLAAALRAVASALADARDDWWIIGSAAVALHGASTVTVRDIDVLASRADALRLGARWGATPDPPGEHALFRSAVHFEYQLAGVTVDVMADLEVRGRLLRPTTRTAIRVEDAELYAPERAELLEILSTFGRPKDLERAALLRTVAG